jgi:hypothetical protein
MDSMRFRAAGQRTLDDLVLDYLHQRAGEDLTLGEIAAWTFCAPRPSQQQLDEISAALRRLLATGRVTATRGGRG